MEENSIYFLLTNPKPNYENSLISQKDTSFCERLTYWNFFYVFSKKIKNSKILLDLYYWPEFLFLSLPNTKVIKINKEEILEKYYPITSENISKLNYDNKYFYSHITSSEVVYIDSVVSDLNTFYSPLTLLKFKNNDLNNFFKKEFSSTISIHLRRGIGTKPNKEYLKQLSKYVDPIKINTFYKNCFKKNNSPLYDIIPDSFYFEIIDKILEENKNIKIYISHDVPFEFIKHYTLKYPDNVVTKRNYIEKYLSYFDIEKIDKVKTLTPIDQILLDLLDFFVILNCNKIVYTHSKWMQFSLIYKNKDIIHFNNNMTT